VVATVAQIKWTEDTENALAQAANDITELEKQYNINNNNIKELAKLVANPDLPSLQRHVLVALITTDVHARDIVQELYKE
jgi:dynein heavy chain